MAYKVIHFGLVINKQRCLFDLKCLFVCLLVYRFPKLTITLLSFCTVLSGIGVYVYAVVNDLRWPTVIADAVFTE